MYRRKPEVFTSFRSLSKSCAVKNPEDFSTEILEEVLEDRNRERDEFANDPITVHYGVSDEIGPLLSRPYKRVERELERRFAEGRA